MSTAFERDLSLDYIVESAHMKDLEELSNLNLVLFPEDNDGKYNEAEVWIKKRLDYNYQAGKALDIEKTDTYIYVLKKNSKRKKQPIIGYAIYIEKGGRRSGEIGKILELEQFGVTVYDRDFHKFLLDESIRKLDEDLIRRVGVPFATITTIVDNNRADEIFIPRLLGEENSEETIQSILDGTIQRIKNAYANLQEVTDEDYIKHDRIDQTLIIVDRDTINYARKKNGIDSLLQNYELSTEPQTKSRRKKQQ